MKYPSDFVAECKRVYPEFHDLHKRLDEGAPIVGRYLSDSCEGGIPADEILEAESLQVLQEHAKNIQARRRLYFWWTVLYDEQYGEDAWAAAADLGRETAPAETPAEPTPKRRGRPPKNPRD